MKIKTSLILLLAGLAALAAFGLFLTLPRLVNAQAVGQTAPANFAAPVGTVFTYQGQLTDNGDLADGVFDFEFKLFDDPTAGSQVGPTVTIGDQSVSAGLFTLQLDFGDVFDGQARYLQIGVRDGSSTGAYETLAPRQPVSPAPYALYAQNSGSSSESLRLGITIEETSFYTTTLGRNATVAAAFRSDQATSDMYFVFPAPASEKTVQAASFNILDRSGSYAATASMTLQILDLAGNVQHTVSAAPIDLQTATPGVWTSVSLSGTPADLVISPGEFLAFHFNLSAGASEDLDVRPAFEVEIR